MLRVLGQYVHNVHNVLGTQDDECVDKRHNRENV